MSLIEWLTGWEYIGNTINLDRKEYSKFNILHPYIIKTLKKNVDRDISHQTKRWLRENKGHAPLGRTIRGIKNLPNFTGIGYAKGKTFLYKGKETNYYIDNQGHGGAISHGMKIWRKLRKDK
jgi:hypothetical protein